MDGEGAEAAALERIEAALDRIAQHTRVAAPVRFDTGAVGARLDRLIVQLRDALAEAEA